MAHTPRASRRPSGASTPHSNMSSGGSSLLPPPLRPQASLASISVYGSSRGPSPPPELRVDDARGAILLADADSDSELVDEDAVTVQGTTVPPDEADERAKRALREQLHTLMSRSLTAEGFPRPTATRTPSRQRSTSDELQVAPVDEYPPRQYFVLTDAGKPVFIRQTDTASAPDPAATLAVAQALISIFLDDGDRLRSIQSGATRITFLLRPPLYYVSVSAWREPESVTRAHLEYLHLQILSIVSAAQLKRIFERRGNFDLRRLLDGAENLLHSLLHRLEWDMTMTMSSLQCLKIDPAVRMRASECLIPPNTGKMKIRQDVLYVILVANGRVVTLARPRKHSIHPSDLHILMNTVHSPSVLNSSATASWLPVCLPKFNPAGFVNAYVHFLGADDPAFSAPPTPTPDGDAPAPPDPAPEHGLALVCVSAGGDFEAIRAWGAAAAARLDADGIVAALAAHLRSGGAEYGVAALGVPGLRHFVYKSRAHVQLTAPRWEEPYGALKNRRRLVTLYQTLHDGVHARSGQGGALKLQYIRTESESVMGWITQPFELYIALSPLLPKSAAVNAANAIARWVKREEARLFLRDAPVF